MNTLPILDYGDELGKLLLFLAVCAGVVVAIRTWAHALTVLRDAGYRSQGLWIVLDGRRQWRTVMIAPEGK